MAKKILSPLMVGRFDVRQYAKGVEKRNQKLLKDGENITFSTSYKRAELPTMFSKYAKPYESRDHEAMAQVVFKITDKCRWFTADEDGKTVLVDRPTNEELDGVNNMYLCYIEFAQLDGDPNAKEASGYWANSIMFKLKPNNPFDGIRFESTEQVREMAQVQDDEPFIV